MGKQQIIIVGLLWSTILGCFNKCRHQKENNKQDRFYTVLGGRDWVRVPLIKPYEAKKAGIHPQTGIWTVEFFSTLGTYNVKRVDVQDSIIYILSGKVDEKDDSTLVGMRNVTTGWYVIDTKKRTARGSSPEKGFASEEEFWSYIKTNNYPGPRWLDIDSLIVALGEKGKLPWMPGSVQN